MFLNGQLQAGLQQRLRSRSPEGSQASPRHTMPMLRPMRRWNLKQMLLQSLGKSPGTVVAGDIASRFIDGEAGTAVASSGRPRGLNHTTLYRIEQKPLQS